MPTTPNWEAATNGVTSNLETTNQSAQLSQFLGTHLIRPMSTGTPIVQPNNYTQNSSTDTLNMTWLTYGNNTDFSQPFTMPPGNTSLRRVIVAVNPVGNGADLSVTLHPDSSGSPNVNSVLASTTIPAGEINALAAPNGISNAGPISTARFNTIYGSTPSTNFPWAYPTSGLTNLSLTSSDQSGSYLVLCGGANAISGNPVSQVVSQKYLGGGLLDLPVQQPQLPQATVNGSMSLTSNFIVYTAGITGNGWTTLVQNTWVASWDSNTNSVGAWSAQANYPVTTYCASSAAFGDTIYVLGGYVNNSTARSDVNWATINNGQITSWTPGPALPVALGNTFAGVIGNWLIVAGGTPTFGGAPQTAMYYARINSDGSLGNWQTGPAMPIGTMGWSDGMSMAINGNVFSIVGGNQLGTIGSFFSIVFTDSGPADRWVASSLNEVTGQSGFNVAALFDAGNGVVDLVNIYTRVSSYNYVKYIPVPTISVPLPVSGLTSGSTYHVVLRQAQNTSRADYLQYGLNKNMLASDALKSPRHSTSAWTTIQSGYSMPLWVYDTLSTDTSPILHMWEDGTSTGSTATSNLGSAHKTFTYTRFQQPLGICDTTTKPNDPLNKNPTFTSGVANWTPQNCTFVQSSAQVQGGFSFSGLMTPNGVASAPKVASELIPITPSLTSQGTLQWYMANGWFYSPTGWATTTLSIDWYTASSTFISTSSSTVAIPAATWTNYTNTFQPPANAAFASIDFIESGTPAASNTVYFSNVMLVSPLELIPTLSSVNQVTYGSSGAWPATGVTQLS